MTKDKDTSSKSSGSALKRLFTVGKNFTYRDLYDRAKKYSIEAIGIFIIISFSFYVENKGVEYETTKSYEKMLNAFKKDLELTSDQLIEYKENVVSYLELYNSLLIRWENKTDSLFMEKTYDLTSSLELFKDIYRVPINTRGYNVFKMGGVDFELMNNELSERITNFYELDIADIVENSSVYEKEIIDNYKDLILKKWIPDLGEVDLFSSKFWIDNQEYLQNDHQLKWMVRQRIANLSSITLNLDSSLKKLNSTFKIVDSISNKMENDTYFIYWKLNRQ